MLERGFSAVHLFSDRFSGSVFVGTDMVTAGSRRFLDSLIILLKAQYDSTYQWTESITPILLCCRIPMRLYHLMSNDSFSVEIVRCPYKFGWVVIESYAPSGFEKRVGRFPWGTVTSK